MSKLETNTIDTVSGTTNLTIGSTNSSTVTFENGSPTGHMYPAFEAYLSSAQIPSNEITTKVQCDTEVFDTDSCYDNSTNYRFTPTVAGKYFVYATHFLRSSWKLGHHIFKVFSIWIPFLYSLLLEVFKTTLGYYFLMSTRLTNRNNL